MKITIFYFSGTGNTWWVAKKIASLFKERGHEADMVSIEKSDADWEMMLPKVLSESQMIGIGHPVYGSSIPENMKKWLKETLCKNAEGKINGKGAFIFNTMAMFSGDTPLIARKLLRKCGFRVKHAINIRTMSNLPQWKGLMTWDKTKQEEILTNAENKCEKYVDKILSNKEWVMRRDPLSRFIGWIQRVGMKYEEKTLKKLFKVDQERCNLCGSCVKFCPVDNLKIMETETKPKVFYGDDCIYCLRCFNHCPQDAIIVMERTRDTIKYRRFRGQIPDFKLNEIKK